MEKATKYQERVIKIIEKIGNIISILEKACRELEEHNPILINKKNKDKYGSIFYHFINSAKKYTILYNDMRDSLFQLLREEYQIIPLDEDLIPKVG